MRALGWYNGGMKSLHPKAIRRKILSVLYQRYMSDPLDMLGPDELVAAVGVSISILKANMHYLSDRGLVEMMLGYHPHRFDAVRLTADGVDVVENRFEFNLRFPPEPDAVEEAMTELPGLVEELVEEVDLAPLDGEVRRCLLRDVQYLRDEVSRPASRWRREVIESILSWIEAPFAQIEDAPDSIRGIRRILEVSEPSGPGQP